MSNEMFTQLPTTTAATLGDIICAVQGNTSVQETLGQIIALANANVVLNYPGNPNGNLAGTTFQFCWDTTNHILYICTSTGSAATAVWTSAGSLPIPIPIADGGTGVTSVTTVPAATAWAGWDANKNLSAVGFIPGYSTTATAAGTTILTVGSNQQQYFTGSTTQTVQMPVASTCVVGQYWSIINNSTGAVTIQSSGANTILVLAASSETVVTCILASGTTASSWTTSPAVSGSGTVNSGTVNELAYYAATGTAISGLATANNGILVTSNTGVPSISSTLPQAVINNLTSPTVQIFTSGSGTYNTPANTKYLRVRMAAGGGGGAGSSTVVGADGGAGGNGGNSTFGTALLSAAFGVGAPGSGNGGGSGGTASLGAATGVAITGSNGGQAIVSSTPTVSPCIGGNGGSSGFGTNQSYGAGGEGATQNEPAYGGGGGGGGGYIDAFIFSPSATYSYAVGAAGTAGAAGTGGNNGDAGKTGIIIVEEYYV